MFFLTRIASDDKSWWLHIGPVRILCWLQVAVRIQGLPHSKETVNITIAWLCTGFVVRVWEDSRVMQIEDRIEGCKLWKRHVAITPDTIVYAIVHVLDIVCRIILTCRTDGCEVSYCCKELISHS
jgi:hypothetical protein